MNKSATINYNLQQWNETYRSYQHTDAYSDDPAVLRRVARTNAIKATYRIIDVDREKTLPLRPKANFASSKPRRPVCDYGLQASRAAEHYIKCRALSSYTTGQLYPVPVFPVPRSGRGMSADFRTVLAARLISAKPSQNWSHQYAGRGEVWNFEMSRQHYEGQLARCGFIFVEVDAEDYKS